MIIITNIYQNSHSSIKIDEQMKRDISVQVQITALPLEIPSDSKEMIKERRELKLFFNTSKKRSYYVLKNFFSMKSHESNCVIFKNSFLIEHHVWLFLYIISYCNIIVMWQHWHNRFSCSTTKWVQGTYISYRQPWRRTETNSIG